MLARFGYEVGPPGPDLATVISAFQRHFRPSRIDGIADAETYGRLADLCDQLAGP
jgi:N-acetylmuramoyl-L-alanine amidase